MSTDTETTGAMNGSPRPTAEHHSARRRLVYLGPGVAFVVIVAVLAIGLGRDPRRVPSPLVAKSVDGGETWTSKVKGLSSAATEALAIDAREPNRLYVWVLGDGLYRSDDAAESWQRADDGPKQREIRSLVSVHAPTGMGGIWLYAGLDVGVLKSPDCFCGWDRPPNAGLPSNRRVYSLAVDPQRGSTMYAGLRQGVFKSVDGGDSWHRVTNEVSDAIVAVHPGRPNIVYVAGDDGTLIRSEDGGDSWLHVDRHPTRGAAGLAELGRLRRG